MHFKSLITALFIGLASLASAASTVHLSTTGDPQVGHSFTVQLALDQPFEHHDADEDLLFFGFTLGFDKALLKLSGYTMGAGFDDDSAHLGAGNFGASAFPGVANLGQASLLLATFTFDVLGAGQTLLNFSSDLGNPNLGLGYLWTDAETLRGSLALQLSEVPEPASMLLVLAGLMGLAGVTRRRAG